MTILIDYSQIAMAGVFKLQRELKTASGNKKSIANIIRHSILSSIKYYKNKFKEYNNEEVIIACDGRNYWRKDIFPYYKAHRAKMRSTIDIDWPNVFAAIDLVRNELIEFFPYKVIQIDQAEADDVIASLSIWLHKYKTKSTGVIFEVPDPILIIGSDKDYQQLHYMFNTKQWSPIAGKYIGFTPNCLNLHIAKGDAVDAIPNVLSDDDTIVTEGKRQNKMSSKRLEEFGLIGRAACRNETEYRNWDRNNKLINFNEIPAAIQSDIISSYQSITTKRDLNKIMHYLMQKCASLLDDIESF